jgi:hypothetical protein
MRQTYSYRGIKCDDRCAASFTATLHVSVRKMKGRRSARFYTGAGPEVGRKDTGLTTFDRPFLVQQHNNSR